MGETVFHRPSRMARAARWTRERWLTALSALVVILIACGSLYWLDARGEACDTDGYLDPMSYEELVAEGVSPYCARSYVADQPG